MNVLPSEKRGYKHDSSFFLRSLVEVVNEIVDTLVTVKDFVQKLSYLKIKHKDKKLLLSLFKKVTDGVQVVKEDRDMEHLHRLQQL